MHNNIIRAFKATIFSIIVALFVGMMLFGGIRLFFGQEIDDVFLLLNKVSISIKQDVKIEKIEINQEEKRLTSYPEYGANYANIKIDKIDVDLPVYFGDTLEILKKGVGHSSGSYFPGEGGSIIYMGHNSKNIFRRFSELQIGNQIVVKTEYGEFTYQIYDMKLIQETDVDQVPVQDEKEILMIYTCYPFNNIGYTTQRYVVYANLVEAKLNQ